MSYKDLKIRTRIMLFIVAYLFIIFLSFRLAFSKTAELKSQVKEYSVNIRNEGSNALNENLDQQIERLNKDLAGINSKAEIVHERVLKTASDLCGEYGLVIYKYPEAHQYLINEYLLVIHQIEIKGEFIPLIRLLHSMEKSFPEGQIMSASFFLEEESRLRPRSLILKIHMQNIENNG